MIKKYSNNRCPEFDVDTQFPDRWSPRAFAPDSLSEEYLKSLFEAARWAPSCYNEQPWLFFCASSYEDKERYASILFEKNRQWAKKAPVLLFVASRRNFSMTGKPNRHAGFDAGAAWMSIALQARKLGLYTHAMGGFDQEKAYEILELPKEDFEIFAAVAVGKKGSPESLPEDLRDMEKPNSRKPLSSIYMEGRFNEKI
jgi:nitroreductase